MNQQDVFGSMAHSAETLRQRLESLKWPQTYMFKFVLPNDQKKLEALLEVLPRNAKMSFGGSKTGKYSSVTCVSVMPSADTVMDVTTRACAIEGVISL